MILVLDLGTQSFRATALTRSGEAAFSWSRPIATRYEGAVAEQNAEDWRTALRDAVAALRQAGLAGEIDAVTCAATLSGLVCLDRQGRPMRPAPLYADRRPAACLPEIEAQEQYRRSGWRAYSGDFLPQLRWLRKEQPSVYDQADALLDSTGYLNYLLTGRRTVDLYTVFTCYADAGDRDWPRGLLAALEIEASKLGEVAAPGEWIGPVLAEWGLPRARVVSVSYDSAAAYLGSRLAAAGDALDISGTVTSFGVLSEDRVTDAARRIFSIPYQGRWLARGSTAMSGGVLEWGRRTLEFAAFDAFDEAVRAARPGAGGVVFLPYLAGARAPLWEPSACGVFYGLTAQTSRAEMARAVYEGLCFSLRHIIETIESCGAKVGSIQLGGGLARNSLLNQIKADVTGKRVMAQENAEVTTYGAASVAARALGWLAPAESYCRTGEAVAPREDLRAEYDRAYGIYRDLATRLFPPPPA